MFESSSDVMRYLASGERIVWEGRGRGQGLSVSGGGSSAFLVIALMLGFFFVLGLVLMVALVSSRSMRTAGSGAEAVLIVPIVILVSFLALSVLVIALVRRAGNTTAAGTRYVITSAAAMIVSESRWTGKRVIVIPLKSMSQVAVIENRDGTGTLAFGHSSYPFNSRYSGGWWMDSIPAFWNIERPLEVYQLIRRQMKEA